jgi:hypothetical protein
VPKVTEIAWAAGFFDGEGCTYTNFVRNPRTFPNLGLRIKISQAGGVHGKAVLERFRDAVGVGRVGGPRRYSACNHRTDVYSYDIQGDGALEVLRMLEPYLSEPKRRQATEAIAAVALMQAIRACNPSFLRKSSVARSPETSRKISEGVRQAWRDPEKRERITQGLRRAKGGVSSYPR